MSFDSKRDPGLRVTSRLQVSGIGSLLLVDACSLKPSPATWLILFENRCRMMASRTQEESSHLATYGSLWGPGGRGHRRVGAVWVRQRDRRAGGQLDG